MVASLTSIHPIAWRATLMRGLAAAIWLLCVACSATTNWSAPERSLQAMAFADPAFGGGSTFEQRLFMSTHFTGAGDPVERTGFQRRLRERADTEALYLARELVDPALAATVADFLVSPAASALWAAEGFALVHHPWPDEDFVAQMLARCTDPAAVGPAALAQFREAFVAASDTSPSPPELAVMLGAARLWPEDVPAIASFAATESGRAWFAARAKAMVRTQQRFLNVQEEAVRLGFLTDHLSAPLPRFLPAAAPVSADQAPAHTIVLDAAGCWWVDGNVLAPPSEFERLRSGLLELRQRGLASGRLTLTTVNEAGQSHEVIAEVFLAKVAKGMPWAPVGELMRICSDPEIGIFRLELDVDPSIVPPALLSPADR